MSPFYLEATGHHREQVSHWSFVSWQIRVGTRNLQLIIQGVVGASLPPCS